jgi:methionyl-tRNA formyltransferase
MNSVKPLRPQDAMLRTVVFCDSSSQVPGRILEALYRAGRRRGDLDVVAVVVYRASPGGAARRTRRTPRRHSAAGWARRRGVPVLEVRRGEVNRDPFIDRLRQLAPDFALSVYFLDVLGARLRGLFKQVVNYHNGQLPAYRGVSATSWALANGESRAGYTFHHVVDAIDAGNILLQDSVPIYGRDRVRDIELRLVRSAATRMGELLQRVVGGDPGTPQQGEAGYYSQTDRKLATLIARPGELDSARLLRLCRAFGAVDLMLAGRRVKVRRIEPVRSRRHPGCYRFFAADGVELAAAEFSHRCYACFRIARYLRGRVRRLRR